VALWGELLVFVANVKCRTHRQSPVAKQLLNSQVVNELPKLSHNGAEHHIWGPWAVCGCGWGRCGCGCVCVCVAVGVCVCVWLCVCVCVSVCLCGTLSSNRPHAPENVGQDLTSRCFPCVCTSKLLHELTAHLQSTQMCDTLHFDGCILSPKLRC
jgi:hypothetical protein